MHQVSKQTVETTQKHAQKSFEQVQKVQQISKSLQTENQIEEEQKERIEAYTETMQDHAQKLQDLAYRLTEDPSTDVFSEAVEEHIKLNEAHVNLNKEFKKIEPPA